MYVGLKKLEYNNISSFPLSFYMLRQWKLKDVKPKFSNIIGNVDFMHKSTCYET